MSYKLAKHVKELRLHMCSTSEASKGLRDFVESHYVSLKNGNPGLPILVRQCQGVAPKVWVREEKGKESLINVDDLSAQAILARINKFS